MTIAKTNTIDAIDDIDNLYIEASNVKRNHTRKTKTAKRIKVRGSVEVARDNYRAAKRLQRANIKRAKQNIKSYKLLIVQAKTSYKLIKLSDGHKKWFQFWK